MAKKKHKGRKPTAKALKAYYGNIRKGYKATRNALLKHDPSFVKQTEGK